MKDLTNEAAVEARFVDPLLQELGYEHDDIKLKTSISEFTVGKGRVAVLYKPDYIVSVGGIPVAVIDAKSPSENIADWEHQCSSYCLELNKLHDYNPVLYFVLTNGVKTALYQWDKKEPLCTFVLDDVTKGTPAYSQFVKLFEKKNLAKQSKSIRSEIEKTEFQFEKRSLDDLVNLFQKIHQYIWSKEKMSPSAAFGELIKIIFVKIRCDRRIHESYGANPTPLYKDVIFSSYWISIQTESESPINDPLLKNLIDSLEKDIREGKKKRFFDEGEQINLSAETIQWVVKELENVDLYGMEEDVHGRMFEAFLDATARGRELGQFFTPRDIVNLMVQLADIRVEKGAVDKVLDACCGSGGFLIAALNLMLKKVNAMVGLSSAEKRALLDRIQRKSVFGIDAGASPSIYRIARMNMYLHGDGGSNIYWADALDKTIGQVGRNSLEHSLELKELREILLKEDTKFDVILSNPPFSLKYSNDDQYQKEILNQYAVRLDRDAGKVMRSLLSSVMFIERYRDLVADDGKIFAVIDESILSGQSYSFVRDYIRANFIILGVISLPGDAFRRSAARVKTSILVLRKRHDNEEQPDVFMTSSVYLGLDAKVAKRIGLSGADLEAEKARETKEIIRQFTAFRKGRPGDYAIPAADIDDRLDVKFCVNKRLNTDRHLTWSSKGFTIATLGSALKLAKNRATSVEEGEDYQFLRVSYDGEVNEGELINGDECSYRTLYETKAWDILCSNMGIGRGAIAIVPPYHAGKFVSNEYTILQATSHEEAIYYVNLIRTKEILADILSANTGMNRGRIQWDVISQIEVPLYDSDLASTKALVGELEAYWKTFQQLTKSRDSHYVELNRSLGIDDKVALRRWLAYKPPE
ncbi:N-6 DNA methylase [Paraburkholderia sp. J12]|uniref:N-6 DNA methylase n=1 Tax=Paraburkholderia sp. J12 TaxID=2805432 RepID=UPI002ABDF86A|nr:N-6 DNA methylase [Paraburkholderia sp. J12]